MRPTRLSLMVLPVVLGATLAACTVRTETTERTVYAPAPARVVYPSTAYYYPSSTYYYYREPYHPAYYSSY